MLLVYFVGKLVIILAKVTVNFAQGQRGVQNTTTVSHSYYSLECDKCIDFVGAMFVLYISYIDGLFGRDTPHFLVQISNLDGDLRTFQCYTSTANSVRNANRRFRNAQMVGIHIDASGLYNIAVEPQRRTTTGFNPLFYPGKKGKKITFQQLDMNVLALAPDRTNTSECDGVGKFLYNNEETNRSFTVLTKTAAITNWTQITIKRHTCARWKETKPKWSFEAFYQTETTVLSFQVCLCPTFFQEVNITDHISRLIRLPLPGPTRESDLILQPYTIPPGQYRICSTVSNYDVSIRRCVLAIFTASSSDCDLLTKAIRIHMTPVPESFKWPKKDLTLNVTQYYSIYDTFDAGYGRSSYSLTWSCSGEAICVHLQQNRYVVGASRTQTIDVTLPVRGTVLQIPAKYITVDTSVIFTFTVKYTHPLNTNFFCIAITQRDVRFESSVYAPATIRCYLNCWHEVNPEVPMVVGFDCEGCKIGSTQSQDISWTVNLQGVKLAGEKTAFLVVKSFSTTGRSTSFDVIVTVTYVTVAGGNEEVRIRKRYIRSLPYKLVSMPRDYFAESDESVQVNPSELAAMFPRYDVHIGLIFDHLRPAWHFPTIITVSMLPEAGKMLPKDSVTCRMDCLDQNNIALPDDVYPHCLNCSKFIYCVYGKTIERNCSPTTFFNPTLKVCDSDPNSCQVTTTLTPEEEKPEYVILRTIWSPTDVAVESFHMNTSAIASIEIGLSSFSGLTSFNVPRDVFNILRRVPGVDSKIDWESVLKLVQNKDNFSVFDRTYLVTIARAIEIIGMRDADATESVNDTSMSFNDTSMSFNDTSIDNMTAWLYDFDDDLLNGTIRNATRKEARSANPVTTIPLSSVVEMVLDIMISDDENGLSYSSIDIHLVALTRMLRIREYTIPVVAKGFQVLEQAYTIHEKIMEDPASDNTLIRLKLEALAALTAYLTEWKLRNPRDNQGNMYASNLLDYTYKIIEDIPDRVPLGYPNTKSIFSKQFAVSSFWLDPKALKNNIIVNLTMVNVIIDITGLKSSSSFNFLINTFVNMAVYAANASILLDRTLNYVPSTPMLIIRISMKIPSVEPFSALSPGMYDISYPFDFESIKGSTQKLQFGLYRTSKKRNLVEESDCYFLQIEASTRYATLITIKPTSKLKFGVRMLLSNRRSIGVTAFNKEEIIVPTKPVGVNSCSGMSMDKYSMFLPAVTLRQKAEIPGRIYYFIVLRVLKDQIYYERKVKPGPSSLVEIGQETVTFNCANAACLEFEGAVKRSSKDCNVNPCTGGIPSSMVCRCDQGDTFAADVQACNVKWLGISSAEVSSLDTGIDNLLLPAVILYLWIIFIALLYISYRQDLQERMMGKTIAIEGVYNPTKSDQYLMCIVTGFGRGCGTNAIPHLTIIGTQTVSPRYRLETAHDLFVQGSEIWLLVSVPRDLGRPRRIILSLESDLESEINEDLSWFVKELYIINITSGEQWTCTFNTWIPDSLNFDFFFSVEDAIKKRGSAKIAFTSIYLRLLRNQHPVFGIISNVPGSSYTKAQHVVFTFFGLMVLMWFSLQSKDLPTPQLPEDHVIAKEFSLDVALYSRATAIACIVVIPIFLVGLLLEKARPIDTRNVEWRQTFKVPDGRTVQTKSKYQRRRSSVVAASLSSHLLMQLPPALNRFCKRTNPFIDMLSSIPVLFLLAFMTIVVVSISYYLIIIGFHLDTAKSLELLYISFVAFIIMMVLLYPILLCLAAGLNTLMYMYGDSYYGTTRDSRSRIESFDKVKTDYEDIVSLEIVDSRTKTLGNIRERKIHGRTLKRSNTWCRQLILKRKATRRNQIRYNNVETLLFIVLAIFIINTAVGSVWESYLQTEFITYSLDVGRFPDDPDKSLSMDAFWDHIMNIFSSTDKWRTNTTTFSMTILTAVRVRQVRAQPYEGYCPEDYPSIIDPQCQFDVEDSMIETGYFANSWETRTYAEFSKPGPFTYVDQADFGDVITPAHRYPSGGYDALLHGSSESTAILKYLRQKNWVDGYTKAVMISLHVFNADSGFSTIVEHTYEFTLAGTFMYTSQLHTFRLNLSQGHEFLLSCLIVIFALLTFYFMIFELKTCIEMGFVIYFTFLQSWFLLIERFLSIFILLIYMWLEASKKEKISQVRELYINENEDTLYVDLEQVSYQSFKLVLVSSLLVIACLIKILLRLRENVLMATFINMIPAVAKMTIFLLLNIIIFASFGYLLFQSVVKYFYSFAYSAYTVTILMLETSALVPTTEASETIGKTYMVVLYSIMFYIVLNYFVVLLNEAYSEHKLQLRLMTTKST